MKMARKQLEDELNETRDLLNSISPSFCLAKWMQHTLYLQNGMNHSCHHPPTHKIPVEEVIANPKALVQSAAIVFLLGLSFEPISLKIKYSP